ncbi:hypothetical protein QBC40DRAFT_69960 [Triangularia verruculosa]|uniref:Uncharacterized protein n=1 Tax=Triangularia verruculosa TaxID=2587418 RepID=A0AAN6XHU3_9PEZI|nr:hypothetical protein QBC40DRAFT_69960 [Triangularia verruculosa]
MDSQGAPGASQQPRGRKRQRNSRVSEAGNTASPALTPVSQVPQGWGAAMANNNHPQAVRSHVIDTVPIQSSFSSQQLDRSHEPDGLMNSYNTPQHQHAHSQYPDPQPTLAPAPHPDTSGLSSLSSLAGEQHQHHGQHQQQHPQHPHQQHAHHHHAPQQAQSQQQHQPQQQPQQTQQQQQPPQHQQQQQQQRPNISVNPSAKPDSRALFQQQYGVKHSAGDSSPANVANPASAGPSYSNLPVWPGTPTPAGSSQPAPQLGSASSMPPQSPVPIIPGGGLGPPPESIYQTFDELLAAVQRHAKEQGYSIVKLRASNYRDGKPTRYDLVCDRGGVKYNSTAKKRNPSTRKVDCPWRAKAVCEVNLGNQWRFVVQEVRHNHEARVPAAQPGQENTPVAQSMRSLNNKVDRIAHDMSQGFSRLEQAVVQRLDNIEKRLEALETGRPAMLGNGGVPSMGTPSMPTANMGGGNMANAPMTNGGMQPLVDARMGTLEGRLTQIEMMEEDPTRLGLMVNS